MYAIQKGTDLFKMMMSTEQGKPVVFTCRLLWCSSFPLSSSQHCNGHLKNQDILLTANSAVESFCLFVAWLHFTGLIDTQI